MALHQNIGNLPISPDGFSLTLEDVVRVAREHYQVSEVEAGSDVYQRIVETSDWVKHVVTENAERVQSGQKAQAYYGLNTGYGIHAAGMPFSDPELTRQATRKLVMSHSTAVGEFLDEDIIRAGILIRANTLAKGYSGIRPVVVNRLIQLLNRRICPLIPRYGSLGASGDLAPLAHLALFISKAPESMEAEIPAPGFGDIQGEARIFSLGEAGKPKNTVVSAQEALVWEGEDQRVVLSTKEGLALTNGATFSAALTALAIHDAENLVTHAEIALAMSLEALQGYRDAFLPQIHAVRPHPGQIATARNVLVMVEGSHLTDPGDELTDPMWQPPQDAYSLRCAPQVIGAVREVLAAGRSTVEREINSATDNPLIFVRDEDRLKREYKAISGGNFHGEYLAFTADQLSVAITELGNISERRTFWMMDKKMSRGLPSMLVHSDDSYVESGLMIAQYVAASLVSKCKTLAHPDSVDSIPSSANQEDHVSMSMNAALHAREIVENITMVIAIEMFSALTAIRHRLNGNLRDGISQPLSENQLGRGTRAVMAALRDTAPELFELPLNRDAVLYPYIHRMVEVVRSGVVSAAVKSSGISFYGVRSRVELSRD